MGWVGVDTPLLRLEVLLLELEIELDLAEVRLDAKRLLTDVTRDTMEMIETSVIEVEVIQVQHKRCDASAEVSSPNEVMETNAIRL